MKPGEGGPAPWAAIVSAAVLAATTLLALTSPSTAATAAISETFSNSAPLGAPPFDHSAFDKLLMAHVATGKDGVNRLDYLRLKASGHQTLKGYLAALQAADPGKLDRAEQFAYWANLYNAMTLNIVLDHYPVGSIRDVRLADPSGAVQDGPWKAKLMNVSGVALSLDDVANEILRPHFLRKDPRGHYMLNCLSVGCPNLLPEAITGTKLEGQLDRAARAYVNHPRGVSVDGDKMHVSSLYAWYGEDFGGLSGLLEHMRRHANETLRVKLEAVTAISGDSYDWALNDVSK